MQLFNSYSDMTKQKTKKKFQKLGKFTKNNVHIFFYLNVIILKESHEI